MRTPISSRSLLITIAALSTLGFAVPPRANGATLIAHWAFDESSGTTAHDSAGNFDGTLSGGAAFVAGGISGNALSLTASSGSLVNMGTSFPGFTSNEDFSIVLWVKTTTTANDTLALAKHEAFSENGYFLAINPTGGGGVANKATFVASETVANSAVSASSVNDGNWHQIVAVYLHPNPTGSQLIYVDGAPSEATSPTAAMIANGAPLLFGGSNRTGTPTATMDGLIDEARVYTGALTDQEIDDLFDAPGLSATPTPIPTASPTPVVGNPTATPTFVPPGTVLDDFFCDKIKTAKGAPKFVPVLGIHVVTAFDDVTVDAKKPTALCLPADKNQEGVGDPVTHLESYQIKPVKGAPKHVPRKALVVIDDFGPLSLDTAKLDALMVPTAKSLVAPPALPNPSLVSRLVCYTVKVTKGAAKFAGATVTVSDQFTGPTKSYVLKKPTRLCVPATVDGTPPTNSSVELLCYKAALAKQKPKQAKFVKHLGVLVNNQLGASTLDVTAQNELCVPSLPFP